MYEHTCKKDKKYLISTNSDCVVTDVETGIVLAVVLAKTQKVVQAISNKFTTSVECEIRPFVEATVDIDIIGGGEDYLPAGYKRIEYLESSGTQYLQFDLDYSSEDSLTLRYVVTPTGTTFKAYNRAWGGQSDTIFSGSFALASTIERTATNVGQTLYWGNSGLSAFPYVRVGELIDAVFSPDGLFVQGEKRRNAPTLTLEPTIAPFQLFSWGTRTFGVMRWCGLSNKRNGKTLINLIPVLDDTGTPCMYDKVSRKCFYNSGSGDFIYPTDEYAIQTLDLDYIVYGKMTETGIRRLYKVPAGETMSRDDYAAANGYKEIIEPPMPREGYWTSQWKETDTQLILEWVETEPPAEEV